MTAEESVNSKDYSSRNILESWDGKRPRFMDGLGDQ